MLRREPFLISIDCIGDTHVRSSITLITDAAELAGSGQAAVLGLRLEPLDSQNICDHGTRL